MIDRNLSHHFSTWARRLATFGLLIAGLVLVQTGQMVQPVAGQGARALGTVDQQQTDASSVSPVLFPNAASAQTFTAGRTGTLDQVDLFLQTTGQVPTTGNVIVQIRNAVGDLPGSTILGTGTLLESSIPTSRPAFVAIPLSTTVPVVARHPVCDRVPHLGCGVYFSGDRIQLDRPLSEG